MTPRHTAHAQPRDPADAILALVRRYGLDTRVAAQFAALVAIVASDPHAPTTVRDPTRVVKDHLADSLVALDLPIVRGATRIADLGAGAGFPGIPLAIALPAPHVVLVESSGRKCAFIRRAAAATGAGNTEIVHGRAEEWRDGIDACDLVVARALAPAEVVAEYAAPLLRVGGTLVQWRGRRDAEAEVVAERAAGDLGLAVGAVVAVDPYPGAEHRHLHLFTKVQPTPNRFPRRAGMARKRPLGHVI